MRWSPAAGWPGPTACCSPCTARWSRRRSRTPTPRCCAACGPASAPCRSRPRSTSTATSARAWRESADILVGLPDVSARRPARPRPLRRRAAGAGRPRRGPPRLPRRQAAARHQPARPGRPTASRWRRSWPSARTLENAAGDAVGERDGRASPTRTCRTWGRAWSPWPTATAAWRSAWRTRSPPTCGPPVHDLHVACPGPAEAVRLALDAGKAPALLIDLGDNIGGGSAGRRHGAAGRAVEAARPRLPRHACATRRAWRRRSSPASAARWS